jgi:phenylpropionate dioxygenase-like ring-hydroxylating dioxygenase large terminal subunit
MDTQTSQAAPRSLAAPDRPVAEGWTLPAGWYSDPGVLSLEQERIFAGAWQYGGRADQADGPGAFFVTRAGHVPIIVVCGKDGVLRGFVNVCRHRGHVVATGEGCRETLQCPYHAWTYDLDGTLRRAPRSEREEGFDPTSFSLLPVSVDTWGPFVFVNPDPAAPPLVDALGGLPDMVAGAGLDFGSLRFHSHHEWEIEANWKVALENYLECYHCPVAHPGFSKVIDVSPDAYRLEVHEGYTSQLGPVRAAALQGNGSAPYDARGELAQSQYHHLWPNTTVNIGPGVPNISMERWVPLAPGLTLEVTDYWFAADADPAWIEEFLVFDSQVAQEDTDLVLSVQQGLSSGMVQQGRLMLEAETLIHAFQRRVHDVLVG